MQLSPRVINLHENNPSSVVSYTLEIRDTTGEVVLATQADLPAQPSGDTAITPALTAAMIGVPVRFYVQQTGPSGAVSDWQMAKDLSGNGLFVVREIPDGAETLLVII